MKKYLFLAASAALLISCNKNDSEVIPDAEPAAEAVVNMKVGLNMNDTMANSENWEEKGCKREFPLTFEQMYKAEVMTQETFDTIAKAGFNVVRLPVTWFPHMNPLNNNVDLVWMNRVDAVVKMILKTGMYCIINVHADAGSKAGRWLIADETLYPDMKIKFKYLWKQIAERFRDYDYKLLFESFNEIIDSEKTWSVPKDKFSFNVINKLNQDFVDAVRATGGRNRTRNLCVSTYATSCAIDALDAFILPKDETEGHIIAQIHSYMPQKFTDYSSTKANSIFYDEVDTQTILSTFEKIKGHLLGRGFPVMMGEYGASPKDNEDERARHAYVYTSIALQNGILPIYWYNPLTRKDGSNCNWTYPKLRDALLKAADDYWHPLN